MASFRKHEPGADKAKEKGPRNGVPEALLFKFGD
jgi:hypothetical protein